MGIYSYIQIYKVKEFTIALISFLFICLVHSYSFANTYAVSNGNDAGIGSLRQAVADAITNPGADIIDVNPSVFIINLTSTDPVAFDNNLPTLTDVTINGSNAVVISSINSRFAALGDNVVLNNLRFSGFIYGCLQVNPSNNALTIINNCDFTNCTNTGTYPFAGAIWHIEGQLNLSSCEFTNCSGLASGAIYCRFSSDKLSMDACAFSGNNSINNGGQANAILLEGPLTVELIGTMSFAPSPVQDLYMTAGDAPFTGSVVLLPAFEIALGDAFYIND